MPSSKEFDVFLSHHSTDKSWIIKLKNILEAHDLSVWLDKDEIRPGDLFAEALETGLLVCKSMVLIVSPEAMKSGWVKNEYYRALSIATKAEYDFRLIPVILRTAELPGFLLDRHWVDFRNEDDFDKSLDLLLYGITGEKQKSAEVDQALTHILDIAKEHENSNEGSLPSQTKRESQIVIRKKDDSTWAYESTSPLITIGRSSDNNIVLEEKSVSWHHGFIERISGHYRYHQISNTNPTIIRRYSEEYIITKKLLQEFDLQMNDRIHIGKTILTIESAFEIRTSGYVTTEKKK